MKDSGRTSDPTRGDAAGDSPSRIRRFSLDGPTTPLDPARHAYRPDVADIALAGRVIASHYAEPLVRTCVADTALMPSPGAETVALLQAGERFAVLDCGRGHAWGYRIADDLVGYVDETKLR